MDRGRQGFKGIAIRVALLWLLAGAAASAWAQKFPSRPVRIILPTQTGTATDSISRYLSDPLSAAMGQRFIVENRGGAGGEIAAAAAARSPADGYTLFLGGLGTGVLNAYLYPSREAYPEFEAVGIVARFPNIIAVIPSLEANSLQDLIALARQKPGTLNVALINQTVRLLFELFSAASSAPLFPVAYASLQPALGDVMAGRVPVIIESVVALRPLIASGKIRPLAITTLSESPLVPNLRSVAEQGVSGFGEVGGWNVLQAPGGTPRETIQMLNTEMNRILMLPETRQRFAALGAEAASGSVADAAAFIAAERARWGPIVKASGLKAEARQ